LLIIGSSCICNKKWSADLSEVFNSSWSQLFLLSRLFVSLLFNLHLQRKHKYAFYYNKFINKDSWLQKKKKPRIFQTNLVEFGDRTSLDDICGHGHVNVDDEQFSNVFIFDGGEFVIAWFWCSGEQRIDDGGDERRT
jgi:hypothetical protein